MRTEEFLDALTRMLAASNDAFKVATDFLIRGARSDGTVPPHGPPKSGPAPSVRRETAALLIVQLLSSTPPWTGYQLAALFRAMGIQSPDPLASPDGAYSLRKEVIAGTRGYSVAKDVQFPRG